jgi:hypothetical protein
MLYGNQRLMYCGLLLPIHGCKFEPVCSVPQAPSKKRAPPRPRPGPVSSLKSETYFAGAVSALEAAAPVVLLPDFLW